MSFPSPKDFYEKYREDSDGAQKTAHQIGIKLGSSYIQRLGLKEKNLESVAAVLNEFQREVQGDPNAKVIGDAVTMQCTGFCPIMRAALTLNISWEWLDTNLALPMIQGIAETAMPGIVLRLTSAKSRGDSACVYLFKVE
jgi:hypothetical protein